jgi:predicted ATP-dependent protease
VREQVLAAHRAGLKTDIMPKRNLKDLVDVPKRARSEMNIVPVEHMDQVLEVALAPAREKTLPVRPRRSQPSRARNNRRGAASDEPGSRPAGESTPAQPGVGAQGRWG